MTVCRDLIGDAGTFARFSMLTAFSREWLNSIGHTAVAELATAYQANSGRLRQIELGLRLDVRDLLPRIQTPTLVIGCARDALVPVENSAELASAIPGASYAELDSGHVAMVERPKELLRLIRDFIDQGVG